MNSDNWVLDLVTNTKMHKYEERNSVWAMTYIASHYDYELVIIGGQSKKDDYCCLRYISGFGIHPRYILY